jgi:RNA polymerase sigma factor (sigma-70 family)
MKPPALEADDVLQDGMIGLLRAIRTNRREVASPQFTSYAGISIRGAIIDGYRAAGEVPRTDYDSAKKVRQALANGEAVSPEAQEKAEQVFVAAWAESVPVDNDVMALTDPAPGPEQRAMSNQLLRRAVDSLQGMSVRDRTVFILCELQGEQHSQVAEYFQLSAGRVSQIVHRVRQEVLLAIA